MKTVGLRIIIIEGLFLLILKIIPKDRDAAILSAAILNWVRNKHK